MNGPSARGLQLWSSRAATSLPTPAGPGDEHAAAGRGDPLQRRADIVDRGAGAGQLHLVADLLPQRLILAPQPLGLGRARDEMDEMAGLERLFDEVDRALPDRGDRGVEIAVAGDHQHRQRRIAPLDLLEQLQPVELRALQPDVEQHQRRPPLGERLQRLAAVAGGAGLEALVLEHARDELADVLLVVDYEDVQRHIISTAC